MKKIIEVTDLTIGYGSKIVLKKMNFHVNKSEIFGILGGSGCGKSTLLKNMIGLYQPFAGDIEVLGQSMVKCDDDERRALMRKLGVTYQGGALFGSMTVAENIALPLQEYTQKTPKEITAVINEKLKMVDLEGTGALMPAELSGGMRKRAGLARAMALDPSLLFFDEPSAGLDPITSAELDRLIKRLRDDLGTTFVIVTHDLDSVFSIANRVIMLDKETKEIVADGPPSALKDNSENDWVREFLSRAGMKFGD